MKPALVLLLLTVVSKTFAASADQLLMIGRHLYRDTAPNGTSSYATERKRATGKNFRHAIFEDIVEKKRYTYSINEDQLTETSATVEEFAQRNFESDNASVGRSFLVVKIWPLEDGFRADVGISGCHGQDLSFQKDKSGGREKLSRAVVKCCF